MVKKAFNEQNNGHLSNDPPKYLGTTAKATWRKIVPFLEAQDNMERIDTFLVEYYATQYEQYYNAYQSIREHGEVMEIHKKLQDSSGKIIGEDFVGIRKNPAVTVCDSTLKNLTKIGAELGLSPKARAELLELAMPEDKDNEESLADLLNKGGGF